ncbi:MAG: glycosyltransferase, partial [Bacteroidota bacterium]
DADRSRIRMIPCGFDPDELWPVEQAAARETLGIPRTDRVVLHLGRMVPRKGVENVIRAFALYRRSSDVPSRLLIAGGESDAPDPRLTPEIGRLQQIAENEGVDGSVVFVGRRRRQELRYWYSAADVFVTTPWYEPFGITPLESMACGTPVIGSRVGGIQYSVLDGVTGYLVPPNDAQALAQRLETIFSDPALRRTLGRKAIERANAKFTWEGVTRQIVALYEGVLAGGRQRLMSASPSGSHVPSAASAGGSHG